MKPKMKYTQRELMRQLFIKHGGAASKIVPEYADAENRGIVVRRSNSHQITATQYAVALLNDGVKKGWINSKSA